MCDPSVLTIKIVTTTDQDLLALIAELDRELYERYPGQLVHGVDLNDERQLQNSVFVVAYHNAKPAGCGALRSIDRATGELKRMYVRPVFRKRGIARMILDSLEQQARKKGYERIWLETGTRQPEAIELYTKYGYKPIPKYGAYKDNPDSLCYEKRIS
jgi:putative acetyltransferase